MKYLLTLLFSLSAWAQPTLVTISGPINGPDGSGWNGRLAISNPRVLCAGVAIPAASQSYSVANGAASPTIQLYALGSCSPGYAYTVVYNGTVRSMAFWTIPSSPTTTTIAAVEAQGPVPPSMQVSMAQLVSGTPPVNAAATCATLQLSMDAGNLYLCGPTGSKRFVGATF